jgi:hypothetical protein
MMKLILPFAATASLLTLTSATHAAFVKVADFDSGYVLGGSLHGQNGWVVSSGNAAPSIVSDPFNPLNQVGSFGNTVATSLNISLALPGVIPNDGTGTLFFRLNAPTSVNFNIGATNLASGSLAENFDNFRSQMRVSGAQPTEIDIRNGGAFSTGSGSNTTSYTPNEWFNVWLVINNATDITNFYVSTGDATTPFAAGSFRITTADPIATFYARTSGTQFTLVDDIYFDAAGANLVNPIPEPATAGLVLLGLAAFASRRRVCRS